MFSEKFGVYFIFPKYQGKEENHKMQKMFERRPPASYGKKIPTTPGHPLFIPRFFSISKKILPLKNSPFQQC